MSEWKPIDTAPKDGTVVLGYFPKEGYTLPVIMPCVFDDEWNFDIWEAPDRKAEPTYWMHRPKDPK